jgi:tetratricopeptide (TPR) repeat protein
MMTPARTMITLALGLLLSTSTMAANGTGGLAGEFLRHSTSIRSQALGRAGVAMASYDGLQGLNPAGLLSLSTKYSGYLMRFSPLKESSFSRLSFALPRPGQNGSGLLGWLSGPAAAWGITAVDFHSDDYEYRDANDQLLDENFGIYQQALMVGFSREFSGPTGIFAAGLNLKFINQGIRDATTLDNSDAGVGLDFGFQAQLLSPPRLKDYLSLRALMPLRLGVSIQNLIAPSVGFGGKTDDFQRTLRVGWSYQIEDRLLPDQFRLLLVNDYQFVLDAERSPSLHFGSELQWTHGRFALAPRLGLVRDDGTTNLSAGIGVTIDQPNFSLTFDFAQGHHDEFSDDQRIGLTINFGGSRDASYYHGGQSQGLSDRSRALHIVSRYPADTAHLGETVENLATLLDPANARRYRELSRGLGWANTLFSEARAAFQKLDNVTATHKAEQAIAAFERVGEGNVDGTSILNYIESHMIAGQFTAAVDRLRDGNFDSWRAWYLRGVSNQSVGNWSDAYDAYAEVVILASDQPTIQRLAHLGWIQSLYENGQYKLAISEAGKLTRDYDVPLDDDYPRWTVFPDKNLADDAQYMIGLSHIKTGDKTQAASALAAICRFYPDLNLCGDSKVQGKLESLLDKQ